MPLNSFAFVLTFGLPPPEIASAYGLANLRQKRKLPRPRGTVVCQLEALDKRRAVASRPRDALGRSKDRGACFSQLLRFGPVIL